MTMTWPITPAAAIEFGRSFVTCRVVHGQIHVTAKRFIDEHHTDFDLTVFEAGHHDEAEDCYEQRVAARAVMVIGLADDIDAANAAIGRVRWEMRDGPRPNAMKLMAAVAKDVQARGKRVSEADERDRLRRRMAGFDWLFDGPCSGNA